jgi:hypothetical protein
MHETRAFNRQCPKDGAKHDVVGPFAVTHLATVGTMMLVVEVGLHLPLDDDLLEGFEDVLAFAASETPKAAGVSASRSTQPMSLVIVWPSSVCVTTCTVTFMPSCLPPTSGIVVAY